MNDVLKNAGIDATLKSICCTLLAESTPRAIVAPYSGTMQALVHRDHERAGNWRITRFDEQEPVGHSSFPSWSVAIHDLRTYPRIDFASVRDVSPSTI